MTKQNTVLSRRLLTATALGSTLTAAAGAGRAAQNVAPASAATTKPAGCSSQPAPAAGRKAQRYFWELRLRFAKATTAGTFRDQSSEQVSRFWYRSEDGETGWGTPVDSACGIRVELGDKVRFRFEDELNQNKILACYYSVVFGHLATGLEPTKAPMVASPFLTYDGSTACVLHGEAVSPNGAWYMTPWWNVERGELQEFDFAVGIDVVYTDNTRRQYGYDPGMCVGRDCG
jgi:hypothetical protein